MNSFPVPQASATWAIDGKSRSRTCLSYAIAKGGSDERQQQRRGGRHGIVAHEVPRLCERFSGTQH